MIISINWIKKFVKNLPEIDELMKIIGARLVEVEGVQNLSEKYKDVIIAKVISAEKVENSDHLNLCKIDDGGVRQGVERDENGLVQVVCGASNVRAGIFVAWLPPEAIVPETFGGENFKLGARKLMGNMSNGMIASLRELDLGDEHDGILEISPEVFGGNLKAGDSFAEKFELNDYLLEVENKSLTHRPDCFGIIGFVREVAGILGQKFENPEFFKASNFTTENNQNIEIKIQDSEICQRYTATTFDISQILKNPNLTVEKTYLLRSGMRPIDAVTDLVNFIMLESGQPLHTFDFQKLQALNNDEKVKMTVRKAFDGEELELLDGKKIKMTKNDVVIATGKNGEIAVALAGAMGGISTMIGENTTQILVESATFNLYNLRNTQMRHGIFSEAITRFTKGVPEMISRKVLDYFGEQILNFGGKSLGKIEDSSGEFYYGKTEIEVSKNKINQVLGTDFSSEKIAETFENVGLVVTSESDGENFKILVPFWRNDLHIKEDLIEEIGRLNGYENIKLSLPKRDFKAIDFSEFDKLQKNIRKILSSAGANEILTYSFAHGDLLEKVGQNPENSYKIINSISPDLQYYRQSLTPSLLSKVNQNIRDGFDEFAIFEINKITHKKLGINSENVPNEVKNLAFIYANKKDEGGFYTAKKYAQYLFEKLNLNLEFKEFYDFENPAISGFEPKRSAMIGYFAENIFHEVGVIGEFKKSVQKSMKLPENTAGFEIFLDELFELFKKSDKTKTFAEISKFQSVERDITVQTSLDEKFENIEKAILKVEEADINIKISPLDIYISENTKNTSFRIKITPMNKTLSGDEIHGIMKKFEEEIKKIDAKII